MRFESTTKVLAKCMVKCWKILQWVACASRSIMQQLATQRPICTRC